MSQETSPRPPIAVPLTFLALTRLVLNSAHRFVYPFLPTIARALGISLGQAGVLVSVRSFAGLAVPLVARSTARAGNRRLIGYGLAAFTLGAASAAASGGFATALFAFALIGVAKPVYDVGAQAYLADRTPYSRRARVISVTELTWAGGWLVGAPFAGWLIAEWGWRAPFITFAILAAIALLLSSFLLDSDASSDAAPESGQAAPRGRMHLDRSAWALLVVLGLMTFAAEVATIIMGAWLEDDHGLALIALGVVATALAVAELTGELGVLSFADRLGKRRAVAIGLGGSAVMFAAWPFLAANLTMGLLVLGAALLFFEFTIVSALPLASEVQPLARARYLALTMVSFAVGRGLAAAIGTSVYTTFGLLGNGILAGAADLVGLVILVRWVREHEGESAPPLASHP